MDFHDRGLVDLVGTAANVQERGSLAIFTARAAAEEFIAGDPFVRHGVVRRGEIRAWNERSTPT